MTAPRLELRGISKYYPSVIANENVNLTVMPGEIHALLGENGAGKSTLMKAVYGVVKPDKGEILWNGEPVNIHSPAQARKLGIGMVFQHFSLFDTLSVTQNIALAMDAKQNMKALAQQIEEVSESYGLPLNPHRLVHDLSVGERQRVEIVRCLLQTPQLLIMDEPTSVLTPQAVRKLFETLRRLSDEGCSILYISHKLEEIRELCHKATVLRMGRVSGETDPRRETAKSLAEMMVGRELPVCEHAPARTDGAERLVVKQLSRVSEDPFGTDLHDINLSVRAGEIFGIAGVSGNGQQELLYALSGEKPSPHANDILIKGQPAGRLNPAQRRKLGLRFVPEERLGRGAVPAMSLAYNALLTGHEDGMSNTGFISHRRMRDFSRHCIDRFSVKCSGDHAEAKSLSGGNVQKYIVGRELLLKPDVLIIAQPTWGVDVGAASFIRQTLVNLRKDHVAILVVSEELDELFEICDRIAVIHHGKLSQPMNARSTTLEDIGILMGGGSLVEQTEDTDHAV